MSHENTHKRITKVVEDIRLTQELLKNLKAPVSYTHLTLPTIYSV